MSKQDAESRVMSDPADPATTPDVAFERRWTMTLLERVLSRLREESIPTGREDHFDALKVCVWGDSGTVSQVHAKHTPLHPPAAPPWPRSAPMLSAPSA